MSSDDIIHIRVKSNRSGKETKFKIKKSTELKKVFKAYAVQCCNTIEISSLKFFFNDTLVSETDTAQSLQLKEDDQIDCHNMDKGITINVTRSYDRCITRWTTVFKVNQYTKMRKVFMAYAERQGIEMNALHFSFNGTRIYTTDTIQSLQIKEDDSIECCLDPRIEIFMMELCDLCESDKLFSLDALQTKLNQLPGDLPAPPTAEFSGSEYDYFPRACMNKNVTYEIIRCLLDIYPNSAAVRSNDINNNAFPLHMACSNESCPDSIIKLLMEENPEALGSFCHTIGIWPYDYDPTTHSTGFLPLHYYLTRRKNVNIDTVKMLVEAYPEALVDMAPIHVALSNPHINSMHDVIMYLFDQAGPSRIQGTTILHFVCGLKRVDLDVVKLILNTSPDLVWQRLRRMLPIHILCDYNNEMEEDVSIGILYCLLNVDPTLLGERDRYGQLPIHLAIGVKTFGFCKQLISAYPESLRVESDDGFLPIHDACKVADVDLVRYLLEIDPESMHIPDSEGYFPIHYAAQERRADITELLLCYNPSTVLKESMDGKSWLPLHFACFLGSLSVVKALFDAYPEAIMVFDDNGKTPLDLALEAERSEKYGSSTVVQFFKDQLKYVQQEENVTLPSNWMQRGDWNLAKRMKGLVNFSRRTESLHQALYNNATLGVVKLILHGNLDTLLVEDHKGVMPLYIACEFSSVEVVKFLIEQLEGGTLLNNIRPEINSALHFACRVLIEQLEGDTLFNNIGPEKNSALHFACRGGNYKTINYLLDKQAAVASARNSDQKLPIHLLCESGSDDDESVAYVETIWRILLANPEL